MPVKTTDEKNNKFRIDFEPKSVGTYNARVFFAEHEIPSSPYAIKVEPSIDVSKVQVKGLEDSKYTSLYFRIIHRSLVLVNFFKNHRPIYSFSSL